MATKSKRKRSTPQEEGQELSKTQKFLQDEEDLEDASLLDELLDETGKVRADFSMPEEFETEVVATQMVDFLSGLRQTQNSWRAARALQDHKRRTELFNQMRFNELVVARIQREYPKAKELADEIMEYRTQEVQGRRRAALYED